MLAFIACSKDSSSSISSVDILAKVGDKIITLDDYYNRAEYTIRPLYCKGNLYIHKKIILNNLIAEKLLSLDSEMNDYKTNSKALESFIKGRKEQAMRKMLYFQQGYQKAEVDNVTVHISDKRVALDFYRRYRKSTHKKIMIQTGAINCKFEENQTRRVDLNSIEYDSFFIIDRFEDMVEEPINKDIKIEEFKIIAKTLKRCPADEIACHPPKDAG